jgi:hypothetical protein
MNPRITLASLSLILLCLFYLIMLGGGNYEQMNITRVIIKAPPGSFAMLTGEYKFSPVAFWATFRPITILLFIITLVLNWRRSHVKRNLLIIGFAIDIVITISTFVYFAPEVGSMLETPMSDHVDAGILQRAARWSNLNYIRLGAFYTVGLLLLFALSSCSVSSKSNTQGD